MHPAGEETATLQSIDELNAWLRDHAMGGGWMREERPFREPEPFGKPHLWKWRDIEAGLAGARRLVPTDYKSARRTVVLTHPDLKNSASPHLNMAIQLVRAKESVFAHRHTSDAIRFSLRGSTKISTITEGERCEMERGDLVVQPNWGWHSHINESEDDAYWIDCLDAQLVNLLRAQFQEPFPEGALHASASQLDSGARQPGILAPPGRRAVQYSYKWADVATALAAMLPGEKSPYDGRCLEYKNAATGGPTLPTVSCWIQALDAGEATHVHRHTSVHLYHAFEGSGVTQAGESVLTWEAGDFFVVPNWTWHAHKADAGSRAVLFSTTDRPALEALGLYREEVRNGG